MSYQLGLPAALARRGLTVELVPGWETRSAGSFNPGGAVCHWTAGPSTGDRPSLNICVYGRSDLAGPLCNVFLTRAGIAVVVAAGRANHAGVGGWPGLVGNSSVFGTEAENSGSDSWTDPQLWAYPRVCAAYCDLGGFGVDRVIGHNEWAPGRKTDPATYTMSRLRADTAAVLAGTAPPKQEDDLTPAQDKLLTYISAQVKATAQLVVDRDGLTADRLEQLKAQLDTLQARVELIPVVAPPTTKGA